MTSPLRRIAGALVAAALLGLCRPAFAQGNAFAVPIGGRSALMGNTGTALAMDGAAPFLNPASVVRLDSHSFAFSANFYQLSVTTLSDWHQPGAVNTAQFGNVQLPSTSVTASTFNPLPSTLCLFLTLADGDTTTDPAPEALHPLRQKLSLCFGSLETESLSFSALPFTGTTGLGSTSQSQSLVQSWNRFYAGPSYSIAVSRRLALGVSAHAVATSDSFILESSAITASTTGGGAQSAFASGIGGNSFDVSAKLGAIYRLPHFTAGLNIDLPSVHVFGSYTGSYSTEYASGTTGSALLSTGSGSFSAGPPIRFALGLGGEWPTFIGEIDATLNVPAVTGFTANLSGSTTTLTGGQLATAPFAGTFNVQEHPTVSFGVGGEYYLRPTLSLIAGTSLNLTAEPPLAPTPSIGNLTQERTSVATVSAGVGSYGKQSHLLVGLQLGYAWGESLAANSFVTPNQWAVIDTSTFSALLLIAGTIPLEKVKDVVEKVEHDVVHEVVHVVDPGKGAPPPVPPLSVPPPVPVPATPR